MEDTLLYPRELIAERVVFTPADHAQIALCRGDHNRLGLAYQMAFLLAAAPGGAGTQHLVNAAVRAARGPHGYLVNVGRGTVVDTQALIDALRSQHIAGAGLDVRPRGGTERAAPPAGAAAMRQRGGHAACRRARARVADRGDRIDSRQPERAFCRQAAALAGLHHGPTGGKLRGIVPEYLFFEELELTRKRR